MRSRNFSCVLLLLALASVGFAVAGCGGGGGGTGVTSAQGPSGVFDSTSSFDVAAFQ